VYTLGTPATQLRNALLASNPGGNCAGTLQADRGHNLGFGDPSCPAGFAGADPKLGALQDNGGATQTIALGTGSAALDAVPATGAGCPATDQRGVPRPAPAGGACDIGAYELAPPVLSTTTTTAITATGATLNGSVTANAGTATVQFEFGTTTAYGSTATTASVGGVTSVPVSATLMALEPGTTYHFKLLATSPDGTAETGDGTFMTTTATIPPTAPQLTHLKITPSKVGRKGATISYTDSQPAKTEFAVLRQRRGIKHGKRCVKRTKRAHGRKCPRLVKVASFKHTDTAGPNSVKFSGIVKHHRLSRGKYALQATPSSSNGTGKTVSVRFTVT
jgi:hypothetical protein